MATSLKQDRDIDGFDLQVKIPHYEDLATELNCMRLRVLYRSANLEASPPKTSPTQGFAAIDPSRGERPGELPSKMHHAASSHWVMVAPVHMRSPGNPDPPYVRQRLTHEVVETTANIQAKPPWGEMVGRLEFSDYDKETDSRYDMLFDLGSSPFWVISSDLESIFMGATEFGQGAHGLVKQDRNIRVNPGPFTSSYVDGSGVTYSTVRDVLRIPASEHLPANLRQPRWIHVIIGVANHAWGRIKEAPFSGIVGLGRQMASDKSHPPSFLSQIGPRLTRPELTIALTRHIGRISFGKRPNLSVTKELSWSKNIPVVDYYNLWVVSSPKKFIENVEIQSPGQLAMFDTGSVFSYLDDAVVRKIYDHIPEHKKDPTTNLFLVPTDLFGYPKVQLQLGDADDIFELGSFFDEFFEPNIATDTTTVYRAGSIQPKSVLPNYSGPDIIGLTALINMELNLQFPASDEGAHKVAWRHKEKNATGVKADWGPGVSSRRDVV